MKLICRGNKILVVCTSNHMNNLHVASFYLYRSEFMLLIVRACLRRCSNKLEYILILKF